MAGSFFGGGCVSDAPPFARLALYMEKCGCFFWKMRKAWWEWHWGLVDMELEVWLTWSWVCG